MSLISARRIENHWRKAIGAIEFGSLQFVAPDGEVLTAHGRQPGPLARFQIREWEVLRRIMARGDIGLGEEYIAGNWSSDNVEDFLTLSLLNMDRFAKYSDSSFLNRLGFVIQNSLLRRNSIAGASRNIRDHYDVGNDFYALWLDPSMTYSSALYEDSADLHAAQQNKYDRILSRLGRPQGRVLEIGCGWGGFAERASAGGHAVTGVTISPAQHQFAAARLNGAAEIRLEDYRKVKGTFDSIVSIEMFEAVGERYWPQYFAILAARLKRGGCAVIQTITIRDELFDTYRASGDFIRHHVFPGGMLPSLSRFREEAERAGLKFAGAFGFGKDYARTLREWLARMRQQEGAIRTLGHDQQFLRHWEFYLGLCAATFDVARTDVVQIELINA
jgi:cyclopropane-fatty-acyl-phospholipid synthase